MVTLIYCPSLPAGLVAGHAARRQANVLMILVLVPFWTSILVRVAAWIVLLQSEGLVSQGLMGIGVINEPLALLFNRTGVVIAMVHILLPFAVAAVQRDGVPPTYLRAAVSLERLTHRCVLPRVCATNLPRRGWVRCWCSFCRLATTLPGLLGGVKRPNAELLHRPLHQCRNQLGHGLRTGRAAAHNHIGAVRRVSPHVAKAELGQC